MSSTVRVIGLEQIEIERLRDRVGRLFAALQESAEDLAPMRPGAWTPPVDLCETREAISVCVELPGVRADQIEVSLTSTRLRVCGEKRLRAPRRAISHLCSERSSGHFSRSVMLRWPIRVDGATARLTNGVLHVHLPKLADRRGAEFKVRITESGE